MFFELFSINYRSQYLTHMKYPLYNKPCELLRFSPNIARKSWPLLIRKEPEVRQCCLVSIMI